MVEELGNINGGGDAKLHANKKKNIYFSTEHMQ